MNIKTWTIGGVVVLALFVGVVVFLTQVIPIQSYLLYQEVTTNPIAERLTIQLVGTVGEKGSNGFILEKNGASLFVAVDDETRFRLLSVSLPLPPLDGDIETATRAYREAFEAEVAYAPDKLESGESVLVFATIKDGKLVAGDIVRERDISQ